MAAERAPSLIRSRAMLAAGFLLLTGLLLGAYALSTVRESGVQQMQQAEAVRRNLTQLLLSIEAAESGQRGYLLTGQQPYLTPYRIAMDSIPALLHSLDGQVRAPPSRAQLQTLRTLLEAKRDELRSTLSDYDRGQGQVALHTVRSNVGMDLMAQIRSLVRAMQADCDRSVTLRRARGRTLSRWLLAGESGSALALVGLAGFSLTELSRRHRLLLRARDDLLATNQALEESASRQALLEEAVRQSRKMEALGALTGGMAHDFNNMLAVVMGNLELAQARLADGNAAVDRYVGYALDATRRASELTRRLLAFARKQPLRPERVSLNEVVANVAEVMRRTLGEIYSIELAQAGGLWHTVVDVNQLESSLINLAVNSRDAMPDGGKLTIRTANVELGADYASSYPDVPAGPYVMVAVTDTGHGMSAEVATRAFDPFFTTKEVGKGTGLGLSQVYGFVKQSGGHVEIVSAPGQGTTVRIYLPRSDAGGSDGVAAPAPAHPDAALPRGNPSTVILLVEDEPAVRVFAAEALAELGYSVLTAPSGPRALTILESHPEVSLLLTDIVMAQMSGMELAEQARRARRDLKVIYMTGFTREALGPGKSGLGGAELLTKPFALEDLARKVARVLAA